MKVISPVIQNGAGVLKLNESVLFDSNHPFYIDVPTIAGTPFRIQFKVVLRDGEELPTVEFTKYNESIIEVTGSFYQLHGSFIGLKHQVTVKIAGGTYNFIFCLSRLFDYTFRAEVTLYEL